MDDVDETYTTAGGLVLHFMKEFSDPSGKQYTSAFVDAPDGVAFMINSTLPRETVKAWAEQLESVRKRYLCHINEKPEDVFCLQAFHFRIMSIERTC
jgi:hypothetical protein